MLRTTYRSIGWLLAAAAISGVVSCRDMRPLVEDVDNRPTPPAVEARCALRPGMQRMRVVGAGGIPLWENTSALRPGRQVIASVPAGTEVRLVLQQDANVLVETVACQQGWIARHAVQPLNFTHQENPPPAPTIDSAEMFKVLWTTPFASLGAESITIDADGQRFAGAGRLVSVHADPGTRRYRALEVIWIEHDVEMRLNLYFTTDERDWWVQKIQTYNGHVPGDWITYTGEFFRSPLGTVFHGNVDLYSDNNNAYPGRLKIQRLQLAGF